MKSSETKKKCPYVERDISWMYFNQRILLEAARPEVPLLERLTFLASIPIIWMSFSASA